MRRLFLAAAAGLAFSAAASGAFASDVALKPTKDQLAAVADKSRPEADVTRDGDRKPAEMMAFMGLKPGDKIVDFIPGGAQYFTKIFADVVGPKGVVYAYVPSEFAKFSKTALPANGTRPDPAHPNIVFLTGPANSFSTPEPADIVWIAQNYHDLKDSFAKPADIAQVNKAIFASLKPGGLYIVLDHVALPNTPDDTEKLHRIDPSVVKKEVEAAGFVFDGQTDVLRNPADPHDKNVFDASIRGHTDQFIYRFRKPK